VENFDTFGKLCENRKVGARVFGFLSSQDLRGAVSCQIFGFMSIEGSRIDKVKFTSYLKGANMLALALNSRSHTNIANAY